jgi:hypothetical protein
MMVVKGCGALKEKWLWGSKMTVLKAGETIKIS